MKHKYFLFLLFASIISVGQNSITNVSWYLQYINVNGTQFDNYFNYSIEPLNIKLNFTETEISGRATCNDFSGTYTIENGNEVNFRIDGVTLMGCAGILNFYELEYFNIVLNNFSYLISGNGETLTLTSANGNHAVFSKTPSTLALFKTWYLKSIETSAGVVTVPTSNTPTLNLTTNFNDIYGKSLLNGFDGCHDFNGFYNIYESNQNVFKMFQYNGISGSCTNSYTNLYTSILSNTTSTFSYTLSNEGKTLMLTNTSGEQLIYSDRVLSLEETIFKNSKIYLVENPATSHLRLVFPELNAVSLNYKIVSVDGKTVNQGMLQNNSINIENLHSGLYFLRLTSPIDFQEAKTLKFIKK